MSIQTLLAFDFGLKRIGVAYGSSVDTIEQLPSMLTDNFWQELPALLQTTKPQKLVVGLPRNLDGNDTAQTVLVREFVDRLKTNTNLPIEFCDEAMSSERARKRIADLSLKQQKTLIDSVAAQIILEDYLHA